MSRIRKELADGQPIDPQILRRRKMLEKKGIVVGKYTRAANRIRDRLKAKKLGLKKKLFE